MITGASSGIGAAAARLFAAEGARVVLMARRKERIDDLVHAITARGGLATGAVGDVTRAGDVERAVRTAQDTYGRLDGAFNNAGWGMRGPLLHECDEELLRQVMDVNLGGVWNCLKYQIPALLASGRGGAIVNTSSTAGVSASVAVAPYVAAKHAVIGLTKAAAKEYGEHGIRVNSLVVGATSTELMRQAMQEDPYLAGALAARPLRRMADPQEVAQAAAWLCSDRASFVTGAALPVDGGRTAA
jgi:NAD(P)-dependent dehydrogenase (short-subunit alcohol dehydrogenase family)